jgi:hypothetical protein
MLLVCKFAGELGACVSPLLHALVEKLPLLVAE